MMLPELEWNQIFGIGIMLGAILQYEGTKLFRYIKRIHNERRD